MYPFVFCPGTSCERQLYRAQRSYFCRHCDVMEHMRIVAMGYEKKDFHLKYVRSFAASLASKATKIIQ